MRIHIDGNDIERAGGCSAYKRAISEITGGNSTENVEFDWGPLAWWLMHANGLGYRIEWCQDRGLLPDLCLLSQSINDVSARTSFRNVRLYSCEIAAFTAMRVSIRGVLLQSCSVSNSTLLRCSMDVDWRDSTFENVDFTNSRISGSIVGCVFRDCVFDGAILADAHWLGCSFFRCSDRGADCGLDDVENDD